MIEIGRFGDFNDSRKRESIAFPSANNMDADTVISCMRNHFHPLIPKYTNC